MAPNIGLVSFFLFCEMDVKIAAFVYLYMLVCAPLMYVCVCV